MEKRIRKAIIPVAGGEIQLTDALRDSSMQAEIWQYLQQLMKGAMPHEKNA